MPPCTWLSICSGFIGRPQSCTATTRSTRTRPVSVSTVTSANCTPPSELRADAISPNLRPKPP